MHISNALKQSSLLISIYWLIDLSIQLNPNCYKDVISTYIHYEVLLYLLSIMLSAFPTSSLAFWMVITFNIFV